MDRNQGATNIQDSYLGKARKERAWMTIFLNNGRKIFGRIRSFDRYTRLVENRGQEQMVFKHAVSTISVVRSFTNPIEIERGSDRDKEPQARQDVVAAPSPTDSDPGRTVREE